MNNCFRRLARLACLALAASAALPLTASAGPVASFDDIVFWVGQGSNRAVVVIDWFENSIEVPSLAWGYRWDGHATGQTMLSAIVAADPRLYAKSGGFGGLGASLYGLGYDDGDGQFSLNDDTVFDEQGFADSEGPADGGAAVGADDYYREGWIDGFWNYGYSVGSPFPNETWKPSQVGMSGRTLHDGDWDSWAFHAPVNNAAFQTFARNPVAAEPPASGNNADFNSDGVVDGSDFLAWQRGFGATGAQLEQGDANGDGTVDAADLAAWNTTFGADAATTSANSLVLAVPEPTTMGLFIVAGVSAAAVARRRKSLRDGVAACR